MLKKEFSPLEIAMVILIPLCVLSLMFWLFFPRNSDYYGLTTIVEETDDIMDTVYVRDCNGHLWSFQGVEDWQVGDCATLIMDNNRTLDIADDIVTSAHYGSWTISK